METKTILGLAAGIVIVLLWWYFSDHPATPGASAPVTDTSQPAQQSYNSTSSASITATPIQTQTTPTTTASVLPPPTLIPPTFVEQSADTPWKTSVTLFDTSAAPTPISTPTTYVSPVQTPEQIAAANYVSVSNEQKQAATYKAWAALSQEDKIAMNVPADMLGPDYNISVDPRYRYYTNESTMTAPWCQGVCAYDLACASPLFLPRMGNYCYGRLK